MHISFWFEVKIKFNRIFIEIDRQCTRSLHFCSECVKFNSIMCECFCSHLLIEGLFLSLYSLVCCWSSRYSISNYKLISWMFVVFRSFAPFACMFFPTDGIRLNVIIWKVSVCLRTCWRRNITVNSSISFH